MSFKVASHRTCLRASAVTPPICKRKPRGLRMESEMKVKRTIAGSIAALLLAVTSMAAACDLSCAFAMASSDCHAGESTTGSAGSTDAMAGMDMGGMDMSGMAMPGVNERVTRPSASEIAPAKAAHPSIGDMGPCERQTCDKGTFVFVKAGRSAVQRVQAAPPALPVSSLAAGLPIFGDVRYDAAPVSPFRTASLNSILRI